MAPPVYSTRFFHRYNTTGWTYYTVPAGHRAVVRSLAALANGVDVCVFQFMIGPVYMWSASIPVGGANQYVETRQVAYGGEQLGLNMSRSGCAVTISGYLFRDTVTTRIWRPEEIPGPPPEGPPMYPLELDGPDPAATDRLGDH